jgi:hypothetical protein
MSEQNNGEDKGGSFGRGCAIAIGIAFLVLAFVFGSCFI